MRLENLSLNSVFFFFLLSKYMLFVPRKTRLGFPSHLACIFSSNISWLPNISGRQFNTAHPCAILNTNSSVFLIALIILFGGWKSCLHVMNDRLKIQSQPCLPQFKSRHSLVWSYFDFSSEDLQSLCILIPTFDFANFLGKWMERLLMPGTNLCPPT